MNEIIQTPSISSSTEGKEIEMTLSEYDESSDDFGRVCNIATNFSSGYSHNSANRDQVFILIFQDDAQRSISRPNLMTQRARAGQTEFPIIADWSDNDFAIDYEPVEARFVTKARLDRTMKAKLNDRGSSPKLVID